MEAYLHKVHYYETDKMGITHHANYVRWMEEARVDFLEKIGWGFEKIEAEGLVSPVVGVQVRYLHSTTFADQVEISVTVEKYNGLLMYLGYEMRNAQTGEILCTAQSQHCFLTQEGKPARMKQRMPELDSILRRLAAENK
ncbi:acyl-CoA thioesterase [Anaerotignum lactatifermentans]|uniref:Acyl-CoA thioesterase n=1 Tax=Anaerotignum lactatifermentans TaxID=160404 RepID=A0ABS2G935_9FIRM|nr:acyl-CoA thioesterase [Anaerotignum lactatifermentans]MBM6829500.1 acyl-CoA thioesterase [Anaerotignum lactatifermentans]MBM6877994.1 acyl-CoA thioesterase [Anaerotignum lactatifermentans]MBM6951175.1 acyl-CoA thioesterase [Anaerotignum lactatifermentans]